MGWEQRGGGSYYYSAERVGGCVVKRYVGSGRVAELAAQLDALNRAERKMAPDAERQALADLAALDAALAPLYELADVATAAALVAAGCHRPKRGPWRKRRVRREREDV